MGNSAEKYAMANVIHKYIHIHIRYVRMNVCVCMYVGGCKNH